MKEIFTDVTISDEDGMHVAMVRNVSGLELLKIKKWCRNTCSYDYAISMPSGNQYRYDGKYDYIIAFRSEYDLMTFKLYTSNVSKEKAIWGTNLMFTYFKITDDEDE